MGTQLTQEAIAIACDRVRCLHEGERSGSDVALLQLRDDLAAAEQERDRLHERLGAAEGNADMYKDRWIEVARERDKFRALLRDAGLCAHGRESGCCLECSAAGKMAEP